MKDLKENRPSKSGLRIAHTALPEKAKSDSKIGQEQGEPFIPAISEKASEICLIVEEKGRIKYCNQAVKNELNFDPSRMIGNSIHSLIPPDQALGYRAALRASAEEGDSPILIDCKLLNRANKQVYYRLSILDCRHHPHIEGYVIHANNIVRLKHQEKKLKIAQSILACQEDAMILIDWKTKKIEFANAAFLTMSGFTKSELFGGKLNLFRAPYRYFLFAEGTNYKEIAKFNRCLNKDKAYKGKIYSKTKHGNLFYHHLKVIPILGHDQKPEQYYVSFKPIRKRNKKSH